MVLIDINYKKYHVFNNEFKAVTSNENTLVILEKLGYYERIISLINCISEVIGYKHGLFIQPTHGGFVPLECSSALKHLYLYQCANHLQNIQFNKTLHNITNMYEINDLQVINESFFYKMCIFSEDFTNYNDHFINQFKPIIISKINKSYDNLDYTYYPLTNTELCVCIPSHLNSLFVSNFHYYIYVDNNTNINLLHYNNLINLCIMVKNGGNIFEEMLIKNLDYFDRWTILDTGSTDNTIEIINRVLVGKKMGKLFQEPFINFGESRNRCLELAGTQCKFNIMLDDTYVINLELREFLNYVRGDQFADSFSLYIKQNDIEYASNRIFKSAKKLKYMFSIHEVIQHYDNKNIVIPNNLVFIDDIQTDEMLLRTSNRKQKDIEMLNAEIDKNPLEPRSYYYLAQTYGCLKEYEKAYEYFLKRGNHSVEGFIQEKVDAFFEGARTANFYLNKPWQECEQLYKKAYELDNERPESLYFLGVHELQEGRLRNAYDYFFKAFKIGYPIHRQYALKPTICFHFIPKLLALISYDLKEYQIGLEASNFYLKQNKPDADQYYKIAELNNIFIGLCRYLNAQIETTQDIIYPNKPLCIFVAPGGFNKWTGRDILTDGMGGSETFVVEIAQNIQKNNHFQVIVFCECEQPDTFDDVIYLPLVQFFSFVNQYFIHTCFISRYSEFIPIAVESKIENIYILVHDVILTGQIIPSSPKIKNVFCLSEWHVNYFVERYPQLKTITSEFNYGVDKIDECELTQKKPYKFIYSSYANRGLYQLLCMWTKILDKEPISTLHIYSDIYSNYMQTNFKELMDKIKDLLNKYKDKNVFYHGWVSKKELNESWKSADVWFYPCVFEETFCLTAYEAAASKTLAITTDLAGLKTTVGNRGILLSCGPMDEEWENNAINTVFKVLHSAEKNALIEQNYKWITTRSWKNQADKMETILLSNK